MRAWLSAADMASDQGHLSRFPSGTFYMHEGQEILKPDTNCPKA